MSDIFQNDPQYQYLRSLYECRWSLLVTYRRQRQHLRAAEAGLFDDKNGNPNYRKFVTWCKQHGFTRDQLLWSKERWRVHLHKLYCRKMDRERRKARQAP